MIYCRSKKEFTTQLTNHLLNEIKACLKTNGICTIAIPGGYTPKSIFNELSLRVNDVDWNKVHFYFTDERYVPLNDPNSNFYQASDLFLKKISEENIHRVPYLKTLQLSANEYSISLTKTCDIIWLGMGADGHYASIFPGIKNEKVSEMVCFTNETEDFDRISLTTEFILSATKLIIAFSGEDKLHVFKSDKTDYPITEIKNHKELKVFYHD